jgi:hypothetical protein
MNGRLAVAAVALALPLLAAAADASGRSYVQFRLVDRTLLCATAADPFGDRSIDVGAAPAFDSINQPNRPATATVLTGEAPTAELVGIATGPFAGRPGGVWINRGRCRRVKVAVPLSSTGLPGPPVRFGKGYDCIVGRRVLVRVRARFASSTTWVRNDYRTPGDPVQLGMKANGRIIEAQLSARTYPTRRPLSFAAINAKRETQLFASPRCD